MRNRTKMASGRKRAWGRTRREEKVIILENMELEKPDTVKRNPTSDGQTGNDPETSRSESFDLQHPEMLATGNLIEILSNSRVPVGLNENRQTLIRLFHKHITPRPQRLKKWRKRQPVCKRNEAGIDCFHDNIEEATEWSENYMEVDDVIMSSWDNIVIVPLTRERKRKLNKTATEQLVKKPAMAAESLVETVSFKPQGDMSSNRSFTQTVRNNRKLKRPCTSECSQQKFIREH